MQILRTFKNDDPNNFEKVLQMNTDIRLVKLIGGLSLIAFLSFLTAVSACDYRKQKFNLGMAEQGMCKDFIMNSEVWRPCAEVKIAR